MGAGGGGGLASAWGTAQPGAVRHAELPSQAGDASRVQDEAPAADRDTPCRQTHRASAAYERPSPAADGERPARRPTSGPGPTANDPARRPTANDPARRPSNGLPRPTAYERPSG